MLIVVREMNYTSDACPDCGVMTMICVDGRFECMTCGSAWDTKDGSSTRGPTPAAGAPGSPAVTGGNGADVMAEEPPSDQTGESEIVGLVGHPVVTHEVRLSFSQYDTRYPVMWAVCVGPIDAEKGPCTPGWKDRVLAAMFRLGVPTRDAKEYLKVRRAEWDASPVLTVSRARK